jgi:hypothetical protein
MRTLNDPGFNMLAPSGEIVVSCMLVGLGSEGRRPMFRATIGTSLGLALVLAMAPGGAQPPEKHGQTEADQLEVWRLDHGWPPAPGSVASKRRVRAHRGPVADLLFSSDARILITAGRDGSVRLWDAATAKPLRTLREHGSSPSHLEISADDATLAVATADHRLEVWDLPAAKLRTIVADVPQAFALAPDGKTIVSALGNIISARDVSSGRVMARWQSQRGPVTSVAFAHDDLITGGADGSLTVWDMRTKKPRTTFGSGELIAHLSLSPNGKVVAAAVNPISVTMWDVAASRQIASVRADGETGAVRSFAIAPNGKLLACGSYGGDASYYARSAEGVSLWDIPEALPHALLTGTRRNAVVCLKFTPDGKLLAAGLDDGTIVLWDAATLPPRPPDGPALSFDGATEKLRQSVVAATLDMPVAAGKSVIWCSSFQIAWNRLKEDLAHGPVRIDHAPPALERLNSGPRCEDDVDAASYYAIAGLAKDGIIDTIAKELAKRFPSIPPPPAEVAPDPTVAVAYACLVAGVKYQQRFFDQRTPIMFVDSSGRATPVHSFGIRDTEQDFKGDFRSQVRVLYRENGKFALDLSAESRPNQVVVARCDWKGTLAGTFEHVQERIRGYRIGASKLNDKDTVLVPNIHWRVQHHFHELEGHDKVFLNAGALRNLYLGWAFEAIDFKLDRSGAEVSSWSEVRALLDGEGEKATAYRFDRPFLVYLKKREAKRPFFVMWVDNAELLCRWR